MSVVTYVHIDVLQCSYFITECCWNGYYYIVHVHCLNSRCILPLTSKYYVLKVFPIFRPETNTYVFVFKIR